MEHLAGLIVATAILATLVAIGWYVVMKLRRGLTDKGPDAREMFLRYNQMYENGEITREEFVAIRSIFTGSWMSESRVEKTSSSDLGTASDAQLEQLLRAELGKLSRSAGRRNSRD